VVPLLRNEQWEFDENGLMRRREASINDVRIGESERRFRWEAPGRVPRIIRALALTRNEKNLRGVLKENDGEVDCRAR